jgi:hypothetical protein
MSDSSDTDADSFEKPENPLSMREKRIVEANAQIQRDEIVECPCTDCSLTPNVADVTADGHLYISHEEDGVGLDSRTPRGETDGCRVPAKQDPTLDN